MGATVDGRWRILRPLQAGMMGAVYVAERAQLGRQVAIKVLHEQCSANNEYVRRFAREARALSRLQHIHCVSILDVGTHDQRPYIVMELVNGTPLTAEIGAPTMTPVRAVTLVRQVLLGLGHAHQHTIVHRDLKPDNIMVTEVPGVGPVVKIVDFGFAHFHDSRLSQSNANLVPGTPSYMSPEQAQGIKTDLRTDLYSVGIILYELCVGHKLFAAGDALKMLEMHIHETPVSPRLAAQDRRISPALDAVVMRAMAKNRDERYQTADEFRLALEATPEGAAAIGRPSSSRHRALALGVIAALLVLLGITLAVKLHAGGG